MKRRALGVLMLLVSTSHCVRHVYPYNHKIREYKNDTYASPDAMRSPGSLWSEGASNLFEDARARRVGDILTIRIDERADATRAAGTNLARASNEALGVGGLWSVMATLAEKYPGLDPNALLAAATSSNFQSNGNTARSGTLAATLPVRIKASLPNGDFYVEGNKVLLLNDEESYLYISGVVRPIDIQPDNSVDSTLLADVELEYTGRGVVSENENVGWLQRILTYIWPF